MKELETALAQDRIELDRLLKKRFFYSARRAAKRCAVECEVRHTAQRIANLQRLYEIASRRSSKPRCLVCGSFNTASLDFENGMTQSLRHKCGGKLTIGPAGMRLNFGRDVRCFVLDEEGNRLETRVEPRERLWKLAVA
jgi:hypothetical protein